MGNVIEMFMEGAYIVDGAGYDYIIAGLPLKEGYTLSYQVPDMISAKTKQINLRVVGQEKIGEIQTWKVEMVNAENEAEIVTMWIDPNAKESIKTVQVLPAMGNGVMTILKK
jgi:hypothetical protein